MIQPYLAKISIFPVKSLDGITLSQVSVLASGALQHDREYALFDQKGRFVNGKRNAKVHLLRSQFDADCQQLSLQVQGTDESVTFHLDKERSELEAWLSNYFGLPVKIKQNNFTGFPDDTNASGPTIISAATLAEVTSWFPDISVEEMRNRIRANIEIDGVPPFWEDRLFTKVRDSIQFQIGAVVFAGINPCARCIVPTRDSKTAAATENFQKIFVSKRKETLPDWTTPERFDHFYRLSINTKIPSSEVGKILKIGDPVSI
ncbi:MOSC N-terminal beta barrel domain-containing protein [Chroococcidiopsidales cyanobacterium LEGE 13417]|nr:MOSC N-terminal beta barrel domain-containing protein [Chroococcidiopsidales cyanobacterium LEGE 13417]